MLLNIMELKRNTVNIFIFIRTEAFWSDIPQHIPPTIKSYHLDSLQNNALPFKYYQVMAQTSISMRVLGVNLTFAANYQWDKISILTDGHGLFHSSGLESTIITIR